MNRYILLNFLSHIDWYITTINYPYTNLEKNIIKCMNELCYNLDTNYFSSLKGYNKHLVNFRSSHESIRDLLELSCSIENFYKTHPFNFYTNYLLN